MSVVTIPDTQNTTTSLSALSIVLLLVLSTLALIGVFWSTWSTARQTERNERIRAQAAISAELFAERRRAELTALTLVAEASGALHDFYESMYGNSGKGVDDGRSAQTITEFGVKFGRMVALEECALELAAYGSKSVSRKVDDIAFNIGVYFDSLDDDKPRFVAAKAHAFEDALKSNFDDLVEALPADFGVEAAHRAVWNTSKNED